MQRSTAKPDKPHLALPGFQTPTLGQWTSACRPGAQIEGRPQGRATGSRRPPAHQTCIAGP